VFHSLFGASVGAAMPELDSGLKGAMAHYNVEDRAAETARGTRTPTWRMPWPSRISSNRLSCLPSPRGTRRCGTSASHGEPVARAAERNAGRNLTMVAILPRDSMFRRCRSKVSRRVKARVSVRTGSTATDSQSARVRAKRSI